MLQARFVVVREATEVVLRHLERLPPSEKTAQLRGHLQDCKKSNGGAHHRRPTGRERRS
jgi:hypothetical protein